MRRKVRSTVACALSAAMIATSFSGVVYASGEETDIVISNKAESVSDEVKSESAVTDVGEPETSVPENGEKDEGMPLGVDVGEISGDLYVDGYMNNRTNAVELGVNGTYTFKFNNKSNGKGNWENFIAVISGAIGDEYKGKEQEIVTFRADAYGWGGGMSDFNEPGYEWLNNLYFESTVDWSNYVDLMTSGVDCEIKISRDNDIIIFSALVGEYTISCTAVSGKKLPEVCYVHLTGVYCELTDIETSYSEQSLEVEIVTTKDIPDSNLYAAIIEATDRNGDTIIQKAELLNISNITIEYEVKDFKGLELLKNLQALTYNNNHGGSTVTDLAQKKAIMDSLTDAICQLDKLDMLHVWVDGFESSHLEKISNNALTSLNLTVKDSNEMFGNADIEGSKLVDSLQSLYVLSSSDISLSNITKFTNLTWIYMYNQNWSGKISDIEALNKLDLYGVNLYGDLSGIDFSKFDADGITSITLQNRNEKKVKLDISVFEGLRDFSFEGFELEGSIEDLANEQIYYIRVMNCILESTKLDMSKYVGLMNMYLTGCGLTEITGLDDLENLSNVSLENNKLTKVPKFNSESKLSYLSLNNNYIEDITSLVENVGLQSQLSELHLSDNKIAKLPDMSLLAGLTILDVARNMLTTLEGANIDKLENLVFYVNEYSYNKGLYLDGNKLTAKDVVGYVPKKFSSDIGWLAESTSTYVKDYGYVYSLFNSELLASDIDEAMRYNQGSTQIYLNYKVCCDKILFEEELLEYIRDLDINVSIWIDYIDIDMEIVLSSIYVNTDNIPDDVSEVTIDLPLYEFTSADAEICKLLGSDYVYSAISKKEGLPLYIQERYYNMSYNVYSYKNGRIERVAKNVDISRIFEMVEYGTYPKEGYYYVPSNNDTYYNYTDEEGVKSDPQKYKGEFASSADIEAMLDEADEGAKISFVCRMNQIDLSKDAWNKIIDKKLTLNITYVDGEEIKFVYTLSYDKLGKAEKSDSISIYLYRNGNNDDVNIWCNIETYNFVEYEDYISNEPSDEIIEFSIEVNCYVGEYFANGSLINDYDDSYIVLDKNMKRQRKYAVLGGEYAIDTGMVKLIFDNENFDRYFILSDIANKEIDEDVPNFDEDTKYEDGDVLVDVKGQDIANVNISAIAGGFTISSEFYFLGESAGDVYSAPIWSLDNRDKTYINFSVDRGGEIWLEIGYVDEKGRHYNYATLTRIEEGKHKLDVYVYKLNDVTKMNVYVDGNKMDVDDDIFTSWTETFTFYSLDYILQWGQYGEKESLLKDLTNKIVAGTELTYEPDKDESDKDESDKDESDKDESDKDEPDNDESGKGDETTESKPSEVTKEEGKNSAAENIKEDKIVEADKVIDTAIKKMEETILKTVEVISKEPQTLSKDVFEKIQTEGKNLTIGVTNEDNQLQYSWTFSNKGLDNVDMDIDLSIKFDTEKKEEIQELTGRTDAVYVEFAHHGELPGPATIKTYVGDKYKNGEVIYLYYFSEEEQKVLMVGNKPLTVEGGYVEYTITHCSTYFFMLDKLEVEQDANSLDDASVSVLDETEIIPPITGDKADNMVVYMAFILIAAAAVVFNKKRLYKEN